MSRGIKVTLLVIVSFLILSTLHVWLNVGFENLGFGLQEKATASFRVGFLPVT